MKKFLTMLMVAMIATPCFAGKPTQSTTLEPKTVTIFDNACDLQVGDVSEPIDVVGYSKIIYMSMKGSQIILN